MSTQVSEEYLLRTRLRDRALRAGAWTIFAHLFETATRLISNLIMTRLLFPEAFGVVAAATALMTGLTLVSDFGVHTVIIQSPRGDREDFLRSAWIFQLSRGAALWVILCALSAMLCIPWVHNLIPAGSVFAYRSFPFITAMLGTGLIFSGATSTALSLNERVLNFKPTATLNVISRVVAIAVMLAWALLAPSEWALVAGILVGNVLRLLLSHLVVPGPQMAFNWKKDHIYEIIRFGKWIAVSTIGTFVSQQSDLIILGILLPGSLFGIYVIAKTLLDTVEGLLERLNGSLALPILSEAIRKGQDIRDRYYRFRLPIELAAAFFGGVLFASGDFVVHFLYDPRYGQAGLMVQLLAIGLAIYPLYMIRSAFVVVGDTHIYAGVNILQAASMIASTVGGFMIAGPIGAVTGLAVYRIVPSLMTLLLASRRHWISAWRELRIVPAFVAGVVAGSFAVTIMTALGITSVAQLWRR